MENGMDRTQKAELVSALNVTFGEVGVVVVTRNLGMTVAQSTVLRQKMREAGAAYKVSKTASPRSP
jgi:large subunit ribosomal protein L10